MNSTETMKALDRLIKFYKKLEKGLDDSAKGKIKPRGSFAKYIDIKGL